jgi:Tfp pilus assembly protein PilF
LKRILMGLVIGLITFQIAGFAQSKPTPAPAGPNEQPPDPNREFSTLAEDSSMRFGAVGEYLTGKVKLNHAPLPWEPIPVSVTCEGKVRYTTNTDPNGNSMIGSTTAPGTAAKKDEAKQFTAQFVGCAVNATLPGFDSTSLSVAKHNVQENPNVGTIVLSPATGAANGPTSSTTAGAPKNAMKLFEKARDEWIASKRDNAQKDLQKAVEIYPQFAEAWYQLGKIQETTSPADAPGSFSKALAADPKFALPYEHMALRAAQDEKWQQAVDITTKALQTIPQGTPEIWYYNALGNYRLGKLDAAEASAEKSLAMDPLHVEPNSEQLLAIALNAKGDYAGALKHLQICLTYLPPGPAMDLVKQQIAQVQGSLGSPK